MMPAWNELQPCWQVDVSYRSDRCSPIVHSDFAASAAFAAAYQDRSTTGVEIELGESKRFTDAQPGTPEHGDQPAQPLTVDCVTSGPRKRDDFLHGRRINWVAHALPTRRTASVEAGQGCWRTAAAGGIEHLRHRVLRRTRC